MGANQNSDNKNSTTNNKMTLSFDLRLLAVLLVMIIVAMFFMWRPWAPSDQQNKNRTVTVTGETTIKAVPDEFVFYPTYDFKNQDKTKALAELTAKSDEITKKLKNMGVTDDKIKSNSDGYNYNNYYYGEQGEDQNTYSLRLTVTTGDKKLAQKVQDYLVTTSPSGAVSPQANFSDKKRKSLENQARDKASKDARAKADTSAKNLGFSVGKVKSISDSNSGGVSILQGGINELSSSDVGSKPSLNVQPGENDLSYAITVVYYIN